MILSAFPGGTGSAGAAGDGEGAELFNFPLTIDEYPPEQAIPGGREGHIWMVMTKEQAAQVHNILFDGYGRVAGYPPGTLLLIVPKLGESKIYANRGKNTGAGVTPLIYRPAAESTLETFWPVTLVSGGGVEVRVEISRPEGHARFITETGWDNIPIYYFNGTAWEAPEKWDYLYWDITRDASSGVDTKWQAFKLDTETFLPIRKKIAELSLSDIVNTIRLSNGNMEPQPYLTIFPGGWAVLGLSQHGGMNNTGGNSAWITNVGRRFLFDGRNPHWYFLKITKKQISYIGQMQFAPEEGRFPYQVVTITNNKIDSIKKQRNGLGVFYQYASMEKGMPTHLCFRRYTCDVAANSVNFWETNPVLFNQTVLDAVYLDDSSGYLLSSAGISPTANTLSGTNRTYYIHYFRVQGDMLVLQQTNFSAQLQIYDGVTNTWGALNLQNADICGPQIAGNYTPSSNVYQSIYAIQEDKITFTKLVDSSYMSNQNGYNSYSIPAVNEDGTRFRVQSSVTGNANSVVTKEYEVIKSTPGVVGWKELSSWNGSMQNVGNYNRDYYYSPYTRNLPGVREDAVVWWPASIQKVNLQNPNALLDVNTFGVNSMAAYSVVGGLGNLAVSSLLPDN